MSVRRGPDAAEERLTAAREKRSTGRALTREEAGLLEAAERTAAAWEGRAGEPTAGAERDSGPSRDPPLADERVHAVRAKRTRGEALTREERGLLVGASAGPGGPTDGASRPAGAPGGGPRPAEGESAVYEPLSRKSGTHATA